MAPQKVQIFGIQDRRGHARAVRPWYVRWRLDGKDKSRSFRTRAEAERFRSRLLHAQAAGEEFDPDSGEPTSWRPRPDGQSLYEWARRWLAEQWPEWQPRTRNSALEALSRLVVHGADPSAPDPPAGIWRHLTASLPPDGVGVDEDCGGWLERWSPALSRLDRDFLAGVDARLGVGMDGSPLAASTASRYRTVAHSCVRRAAELGVIRSDPWPPPPRGRSRRKVARARGGDLRQLPEPSEVARLLAAMESHQPASRMYRVMTAVAYYAGMRPSEVVALCPRHLELPEEGWGVVHVREADTEEDGPGEPKTGPRDVPIPPVLVSILREWVEEGNLGPDDPLFRTRGGLRPAAANWSRSLRRALRIVGLPPLRVYDLRHAAATTWLRAGAPLGEVARRLGHSGETLVSVYVGALSGDEALANDRIDAALSIYRSPSGAVRPGGSSPANRPGRTR